jgi:hypothetical protein
MDGNVVSLHGNEVLGQKKPNRDLIEKLEWLLEAARSGEVQGMIGVYLFDDGSTGWFRVGAHTYSQVGRLEQVKRDALAALD